MQIVSAAGGRSEDHRLANADGRNNTPQQLKSNFADMANIGGPGRWLR